MYPYNAIKRQTQATLESLRQNGNDSWVETWGIRYSFIKRKGNSDGLNFELETKTPLMKR